MFDEEDRYNRAGSRGPQSILRSYLMEMVGFP